MATSKIYEQKLLYLGRGVDCRKGHEEWLPKLEQYSGDQIRRIPHNYRENPLSFFSDTTNRSGKKTDAEIGGKIRIQHGFIPIDLSTGFLVELNTKETAKAKKKRIINRTATLPNAVEDDPGAIEVPSNTGKFKVWHSEFEQNLCAYVLKTNDTNFRELFQTDYPGIPQQDDHTIPTFNNLIDCANKKKMSEKFWQFVYDACISFLEEKEYTHYVYSITLGAERAESDSDEISTAKVSFSPSANAQAAEASGTVNFAKSREDHHSHEYGRGRIETDSGGNCTVSVEEVIGIGVKSIANLISNKQLKLIMRAILESYNPLRTDKEFGPYRIFCREQSSGEQEIYWCVKANEVYGTHKPDEACHFYITICQKDPLRFYITYKTSKGTKQIVKVKQPYATHLPLQLVLHSWQKDDILYTLEPQNVADKSTIPPTPSAWQDRSPFFIKQPEKWWGLYKAQRYTKIVKCSKESMPEYQTSTSSTIDEDNSDMMLLYFKKVIELQDGQGTLVPHAGDPLPESTENDDSQLWRISEDQGIEDTKEMFYKLVGTDEILL